MKKMASILLIIFFALAVIGRLSSFFDRVQYQGISQDPSYRSLQVEQKLTPEQLEEYGVLLDEQQQEQQRRAAEPSSERKGVHHHLTFTSVIAMRENPPKER